MGMVTGNSMTKLQAELDSTRSSETPETPGFVPGKKRQKATSAGNKFGHETPSIQSSMHACTNPSSIIITHSLTHLNTLLCFNMLSTRVVLPWSTCAMIWVC